jgi:hypothetical protein
MQKPHEVPVRAFAITCLICGQHRHPLDEHEDLLPCECAPGPRMTLKEKKARIAELAAKRRREFVQ